MNSPIRILMLEDNARDAELIESQLEASGIAFAALRVDTRNEFIKSLHSFRPDIILSDFTMPLFDGLTALDIALSQAPHIPFIFISGTIGEEKAIEALKRGATDYVLKDRPTRLVTSMLRALREAEERAERKRVEDELRKNQELFRLITENVVDLIAVIDPEGRRLYNSPSYAGVLGDPVALHGTDSFREIHPGDRDRMKEIFAETVRTGVGRKAEFRFLGKDGEVRYFESNASVIKDPQGKVSRVVVVSREITERKLSELERESLGEQLRQAQRMESIGTLAGGVAHDFNNVLAIILGYAETLTRQQPDAETVQKAAVNIIKSTQRGTTLVRQLMTFARKTAPLLEMVDVNTLCRDLLEMVSATFPKTISISPDLADGLPAVTADSAQLNQALLNLCVNARDAMPQGGNLTIQTALVNGSDLRKRHPDAGYHSYVAIRVRDTGIGMDAVTLQRIFEPFFTTKEVGKGTGLGLAVVYGVIKGHGGFVDVESSPSQGAVFHLYFPVKRRRSVVLSTEDIPDDVPGGHETLLLVEDEEMLLELIKELLTDRGYTVLTARTGREALEVFRAHADEIALVVSDLGLPEMTGADAFMEMKMINPKLKAVFATGYADEASIVDLTRTGVSHVVHKPYVPAEIMRVVRASLDSPAIG
jgi:PAS domain S-box-containing protein